MTLERLVTHVDDWFSVLMLSLFLSVVLMNFELAGWQLYYVYMICYHRRNYRMGCCDRI